MNASLSRPLGKILFVGQFDSTHVAGCLQRAAINLGCESKAAHSQEAFSGPELLRRMSWWLNGRKPPRLAEFSSSVVRQVEAFSPELVIATGISPMNRGCLDRLRALGVRTANYLTDDPWNRSFRSSWFLKALPHYDLIFSPRSSNMAQLMDAGCRQVIYLPFAFDPSLHYLPEATDPKVASDTDVVFIGGCDADRIPIIESFIRQGINISLYGGGWGRFRSTRSFWQGECDPAQARGATREAKIALCLLRRANRDGHTMRTFEIAAQGGCMLAEYSDEHRAIFGPDGDCAVYFRTEGEMIERAKELIADPSLRLRLSRAIRERIIRGQHTYQDRLRFILLKSRIAERIP